MESNLITILQKSDKRQSDLFGITSPYWCKYAATNRYNYVIDDGYFDVSLNGMWMKWNAVERLLSRISEGEWIFWCDADSLPMNFNFKVEDLIDSTCSFVACTWLMHNNLMIKFTDDVLVVKRLQNTEKCPWVTINTGNFLIKKSRWSVAFVRSLFEFSDFFENNLLKNHIMGDELAVAIKILFFRDNRLKSKFLEGSSLFTKPKVSFKNYLPGIKEFEEGDFILHAAALSLEEKISTLVHYTKRIVH